MDTHLWLSRIITGILSILTASRLRDRVYTQQQRISQLELAIEDIDRINSASDSPNRLVERICAGSQRDL
jgi:hypothetical protein